MSHTDTFACSFLTSTQFLEVTMGYDKNNKNKGWAGGLECHSPIYVKNVLSHSQDPLDTR